MNNVSLVELENERIEALKKYGLDTDSINEFKSKIKKVSQEESDKLGEELLKMIFNKKFNDNYEEALKLIYAGANIEVKTKDKGNCILLICSIRNYLNTFLLLIKAGANVNQVNNYLTTPTMASARHGNKEMLEILILMDADINARCLDGDNAIMMAKRHEQVECFNMLLNEQAYLNNRNLLNQTIIDIPGDVNFDLSLFEDSSFSEIIVSKTEKDVLSLISEAENSLNKIIK